MPFFLMLFLSTTFSLQAAPSKEVEEAQKSIMALIRPLIPGNTKQRPIGTEKFSVDKCPKQKVNWMDVITMKKTVTLSYKFQKGCDIQGDITPKVFRPFPAALDLKNLDKYNKVESQNKVTASFEARPIMNLEMTSGVLSGKDTTVKFEADYSVRINPMDSKKPVDKNLGGEIRITEINGKKVSIKEKILIQ